ncbi:dTMP kinase, partial [Candidatus Poribacteria bacterium]|nr:dTMP kinase [Candidatus Poribacteria bacterium]
MTQRGLFITFEGTEGSGKTTQIQRLSAALTQVGYGVLVTREPGGTLISQQIREILLNPNRGEMAWETELLLFAAARAQHVSEVIAPALEAGKLVISDRFSDSTIAYQ